jgi:uncharacterized protein (DUF362 family)
MVSRGIKTLTGAETDAAAWGQFVSTNDVVGIKIATQAAPLLASHPALVEAIQAGLHAAGVPAENIIVFDRDPQKLRAAGFKDARAVAPDGWDSAKFYESRVVGKLIWGDMMFGTEEEGFGGRSHLPKLVTQTITKIINVPVLQDNEACGVGGCLYNTSVGMVDNSRRFEFPGQNGDPDITLINMLPNIHGKVVLHVMDALVAGYAGGPVFKQQYSWEPGLLYFSRDPVAIDARALEQIDAQRKQANIPAITDRAGHLATAERYKLGGTNAELVEATLP